MHDSEWADGRKASPINNRSSLNLGMSSVVPELQFPHLLDGVLSPKEVAAQYMAGDKVPEQNESLLNVLQSMCLQHASVMFVDPWVMILQFGGMQN